MKALAYIAPNKVHYVEAPEPAPSIGHAIVNVAVAGICGTDIGAVKNGRPALQDGMTLGHEFVGRRDSDGKFVVANPILTCGTCLACRRGETNLCNTRKVIGVHCPGAFAEKISVPNSNLVEWKSADLTRAALVEPIATALHGWRRSRQPRTGVAIIGAGAIGLSVLAVLKHEGIENIAISDTNAMRLDLARHCGADHTSIEDSDSFNAVLECVGAVSTRQKSLAVVRPGGTVVLLGLHDAELSTPAGPIVAGERNIVGSFGYTHAEFEEAVTIAEKVDTRWVRSVSFQQARETFAKILEGRDEGTHAKVQIRMN